MDVPRERLRYSRAQGGKPSVAGWVEINLRGLDLEGASTVRVNLDDVDRLRAADVQQEDAFRRVRELLGG